MYDMYNIKENNISQMHLLLHLNTKGVFGMEVIFESEEEYLSEDFVEEGINSDSIAPWEGAFMHGWRKAMR